MKQTSDVPLEMKELQCSRGNLARLKERGPGARPLAGVGAAPQSCFAPTGRGVGSGDTPLAAPIPPSGFVHGSISAETSGGRSVSFFELPAWKRTGTLRPILTVRRHRECAPRAPALGDDSEVPGSGHPGCHPDSHYPRISVSSMWHDEGQRFSMRLSRVLSYDLRPRG